MRPLLNQGVQHSRGNQSLALLAKRAFSVSQGPPKAKNNFAKDFDRLVDHYVRNHQAHQCIERKEEHPMGS